MRELYVAIAAGALWSMAASGCGSSAPRRAKDATVPPTEGPAPDAAASMTPSMTPPRMPPDASGGGMEARPLDAAAADLAVAHDAAPDAAAPRPDVRTPDAAPAERPSGLPSAYNPCPMAGAPCRIMPFGDSITDGVGSSGGGYRVPLFRAALAAHQSITFVGSGTNGPATVDGVAFPRQHEGHSGYTIDNGGGRAGITPLVDKVMPMYKPHVVLLMIGTNDVDIQLDLANAPTRLGILLDKIAAAAPDALTVVAQIVPTTSDATNARVRTYNDAIPALVKARADAGKHVVMVDMYGAFTANAAYKTAYMSDGLHPKDAGYAVMSGVWYAAIGALLR